MTDSPPAVRAPTRNERASWGVAFAGVLLAAFVYAETRAHFTAMLPGNTPYDVMLGQASTPFQYRLLVPKIVLILITLFPGLVSRTHFVLSVFEGLFFVAAVLCVDGVGARLGEGSIQRAKLMVAFAAFPFAYLVLPPFRPYFNASDTAGLFFCCACTLAAVAGRGAWFFALVVVGTFNRETTLLPLAAWTFAARGRGELPRYGRWLAASALGIVSVKAFLLVTYASNGGASFAELHHVGGPLHVLTNLHDWVTLPRAAWFHCLVTVPLLLAFAMRRHAAHPVLASSVGVVACYIGVLSFIGNADELRMFADAAGLLFLAIATARPMAALS